MYKEKKTQKNKSYIQLEAGVEYLVGLKTEIFIVNLGT